MATSTEANPAWGDGISLADNVWPGALVRGDDGALQLEQIPIAELVERFGTPLFVVSEREFRDRCVAYRNAVGEFFGREIDGVKLAGARVNYGAKAFLCTGVARWVHEEGLGIDVCTGGELAVAMRAQTPGESIAMHGNNKSVEEIERALDAGLAMVIIDSIQEVDRVAAAAKARGIRQPVMLRVAVGVEAHTHEFIQTANRDQKFGLSPASGTAVDGVRAILAHPEELELRGLHSHIGSQILDLGGFTEAAERLLEFHAKIEKDFAVELPELGLGGGLGIAYTADDVPLSIDQAISGMASGVATICARLGLAVPQVTFEPGRSIVGTSTITVYRVGTIKDVLFDDGTSRRYVAVDGGMSDNIRTALYDAEYSAVLAGRTSAAGPVLSRIVGKHCESGDIVVRNVFLPEDLAPGDLLAVAATGAYGYALASNYNHVPRPAVVAVVDPKRNPGGDGVQILLRRETEDDLLRLDVS